MSGSTPAHEGGDQRSAKPLGRRLERDWGYRSEAEVRGRRRSPLDVRKELLSCLSLVSSGYDSFKLTDQVSGR